jgi:uncharacterized protein
MTNLNTINEFLAQKHIAIAGVSRNKKKFGNILFRALAEKGIEVYPIHPSLSVHEEKTCYASVIDLPDDVSAIVINTKPEQTSKIAGEAIKKGIRYIWLQQGSADKQTIDSVTASSPGVISERCLLMFLEPVKGIHGFHRWISKVFGSYPN